MMHVTNKTEEKNIMKLLEKKLDGIDIWKK